MTRLLRLELHHPPVGLKAIMEGGDMQVDWERRIVQVGAVTVPMENVRGLITSPAAATEARKKK